MEFHILPFFGCRLSFSSFYGMRNEFYYFKTLQNSTHIHPDLQNFAFTFCSKRTFHSIPFLFLVFIHSCSLFWCFLFSSCIDISRFHHQSLYNFFNVDTWTMTTLMNYLWFLTATVICIQFSSGFILSQMKKKSV